MIARTKATRGMASVRPADIVVLVPVVGCLLLIMAIAAMLPAARRAARADPLIASHAE